MIAGDLPQAFRQSIGGPARCHRAIDDIPHVFAELDIFNVLGEIIQSTEQVKGVAERCQRSVAEAGCQAQPGLPAQFDHNAIFNFMDADRESSLSARQGSCPCSDLDCHIIELPNPLRIHVAAVEFCHQCAGDIIRFDVSVKDLSIHVFDYNPLYKRRRDVVVIPSLYDYLRNEKVLV
jgi:hypothetical protein